MDSQLIIVGILALIALKLFFTVLKTVKHFLSLALCALVLAGAAFHYGYLPRPQFVKNIESWQNSQSAKWNNYAKGFNKETH